jgi:hypothetical protein
VSNDEITGGAHVEEKGGEEKNEDKRRKKRRGQTVMQTRAPASLVSYNNTRRQDG